MVGISIIGLGYWGPKLVRNLRGHPEVEVRMLYDVDRDAARRIASAEEFVASSLDDVLNDSRTDGVVIATPSSTHAGLIEAALKRGKHVFVEKPLSRTLEEADNLVNVASKSGRVLMVGHTYLFNSAIQHVRDAIDDGQLGPLQYLTSVRTNLGPIRTDVGAAFDLASHDVAICAYLFGCFPTRVSATGGSWINRGVHDAVFISLFFADDRIAHIQASWLHPRKERRVVVVGASGMLVFNDLDADRPVEFFDKGVTLEGTTISGDVGAAPPSFRVGDIHAPFIQAHEPLSQEVAAFVAAVAHGAPFVSDARFGRNIIAVLESANRSISEGGSTVEVPRVI